jgi:hypothetical protein
VLKALVLLEQTGLPRGIALELAEENADIRRRRDLRRH